MDINDPPLISLHHLLRNPYQKSCQHNQIQPIRIYLLKKRLLKLRPIGKILRGQADCFNPVLSCPL
jgi:hypothetical protein